MGVGIRYTTSVFKSNRENSSVGEGLQSSKVGLRLALVLVFCETITEINHMAYHSNHSGFRVFLLQLDALLHHWLQYLVLCLGGELRQLWWRGICAGRCTLLDLAVATFSCGFCCVCWLFTLFVVCGCICCLISHCFKCYHNQTKPNTWIKWKHNTICIKKIWHPIPWYITPCCHSWWQKTIRWVSLALFQKWCNGIFLVMNFLMALLSWYVTMRILLKLDNKEFEIYNLQKN